MSFRHTSEVCGDQLSHAFDVVTCMETLEHCLPHAVDHVLGELRRLVKPNGVVIISVPIETGPVLIAKQIMPRGRRLATVGRL